MSHRTVTQRIQGRPASDGAGVKLTRIFTPGSGFDPFLMLDELSSDDGDVGQGFPPHPHRGFETITYLTAGAITHEDHVGHRGHVGPGGLQWMTTGRGIIHSEMPEARDGRLHGFQVWLNLPAADKMRAPEYRDIEAGEIPEMPTTAGSLRVLAGHMMLGETPLTGPVTGGRTDPVFLDVRLEPAGSLNVPTPAEHTVLVYAFSGNATVGGQPLRRAELAVTSNGHTLTLGARKQGAGLLVLMGHPLGEPIAHHGPFVMNTADELEEALQDYRAGRLTQPPD